MGIGVKSCKQKLCGIHFPYTRSWNFGLTLKKLPMVETELSRDIILKFSVGYFKVFKFKIERGVKCLLYII